jgi:hypothetical protein
MKKLLKWIFGVLVIVIVCGITYVRLAMGMSLPEGVAGIEADALASKMMVKVNEQAWNDTRFLTWSFAERNTYIWDRSRSLIHISFDNAEVVLHSQDLSGWAIEHGEVVSDSEYERLQEKAWSNFCNDSFWLIAPLKVMDDGVQRKLVDSDKGSALLVTYPSGGVTPGDSYLWFINEDGLPYAYRMWVDIIPVPGLEVSWEDWTELHTGVLVAQKHMLGPLNISITDLKSGSTLEEIGLSKDPFVQ